MKPVKLADLSPALTPSPVVDYAQRLTFLCPACRKRLIYVDICRGRAHAKLWHAEQGPDRSWGSLTITPSIDATHAPDDREPACVGWHGLITDGEIR